ncbi:hypothetical protein PMAYCL1PPCAC_25061, partial [Pristionchus mayeri]
MSPNKRIKLAENEDASHSSSSSSSTHSTPRESEDGYCSNTIIWEVKVSEIGNSRKYSHKVDAQGVPWRIFIYKSAISGLGIFLMAMDNQSTMWTAEVDGEFIVICTDRTNDIKHRFTSLRFSHRNQVWGFDKVVAWDDLINPEK